MIMRLSLVLFYMMLYTYKRCFFYFYHRLCVTRSRGIRSSNWPAVTVTRAVVRRISPNVLVARLRTGCVRGGRRVVTNTVVRLLVVELKVVQTVRAAVGMEVRRAGREVRHAYTNKSKSFRHFSTTIFNVIVFNGYTVFSKCHRLLLYESNFSSKQYYLIQHRVLHIICRKNFTTKANLSLHGIIWKRL